MMFTRAVVARRAHADCTRTAASAMTTRGGRRGLLAITRPARGGAGTIVAGGELRGRLRSRRILPPPREGGANGLAGDDRRFSARVPPSPSPPSSLVGGIPVDDDGEEEGGIISDEGSRGGGGGGGGGEGGSNLDGGDVGGCGGGDVTAWDERRRLREEMVSLAGGVDRDPSAAGADDSDADIAGRGGGRIPLQSPEMAMLLFDALAPHLEKRHLRSLSGRLSKFASSHSAAAAGDGDSDSARGGDDGDDSASAGVGSSPLAETGGGVGGGGPAGAFRPSKSKKRIHNGMTLVYQLNEYFSKGGGGKKSDANNANANANPWVRPLLCHFLVGYDISGYAGSAGISSTPATAAAGESASSTSAASATNANVWEDPTFPPNANRSSWDGDVSTLLAAREGSALGPDGPPHWRRRRRRTSESESQRSQTRSRADVARAIHSTKSEGRNRGEAEEMASLLADRLPRATHGKLMAFLSEYAASIDDAGEEEEKGEKEKNKEEKKKRKARGGDRPMRNLGKRLRHVLGFHLPLVAAELADFLYVLDLPPSASSTPASSAASEEGGGGGDGDRDDDDLMMVKAWEEWNDARSTLVEAFLSSQKEYARRPPVRVDARVDARKQMVEKVTDTIAELNALRVNADGVAVDVDAARDRDPSDLLMRRGPKLTTSTRRRNAVHIVFDALMLSDELTGQIREENETVANRRRVFLNNLPVDATEEEVRALYGRCGPIENVTVHNLRPDLDPGALSKREVAEMKKKRRGAFRRGVRRTPVYAMVDFETEEGYDVATGDNLTVFGMVVRKHPVRSIPASRLRSLFIENIPPGHYSMDLEYKISKVLHPEIYVCLDVGDHDYSEPYSCEIKFPSHEIASFAYERLRHVDMGSDDCVVNWMRTPKDAEEYWTRELGFDG